NTTFGVTAPPTYSGGQPPTFTVTATATETNLSGGGCGPNDTDQTSDNTASTSATDEVVFQADQANGTVSGTGCAPEDGQANQYLGDTTVASSPLTLTFTPTDNETLTSFTINNIPLGVTISDGTQTVVGTGSNSITILAANVANAAITPAANNSDVDISLSVTANISDPDSGLTGTANTTVTVFVDAVADKPTAVTIDAVSTSGDETFQSSETGTVTVNATFGDATDGSEVHTVTVTAPAGFVFTSTINAGGATGITGLGTGTLTMTVPNGTSSVSPQFAVTAPPTYSGGQPPTFTVTATATETNLSGGGCGPNDTDQTSDNTASTSAADDGVFRVANPNGTPRGGGCAGEDGQANQHLGNTTVASSPLTLTFTPADNETLTSFTINNIPTGVKISDGTQTVVGTGSNSITILAANVANAAITPAPNNNRADISLRLTA